MKKQLIILVSIVVLSVFIGLTVRFVFAQIGWYEPTGTPPEDNEIPLWIRVGNDLYHTTGGNVGIGTIDPRYQLDVRGQQYGIYGSGSIAGIYGYGAYGVYAYGSSYGVYSAAGNNYFSGNVGIGTTSPGYKLDVSGDVNISGTFRVNGTPISSGIGGSGSANYLPKWTGGTSLGNSLIYDDGANIGIGTTSSTARLTIKRTTGSSLSASDNYTLDVFNAWTSGRNYGIRAEATGSGATVNTGGIFNASGAMINRAIYIGSPSAGVSNYAIYSGSIAKSYFAGNVGIGATSPAEKLDVNGNLRVTGNTTLGNTDTDMTTVYGTLQGAGGDLKINATVAATDSVLVGSQAGYALMNIGGTDYWLPIYKKVSYLVNKKHLEQECAPAGGTVVTDGAGNKFCRFTAASCPSGWTQYNSWSKTTSWKCWGGDAKCLGFACGGKSECTTGGHSWSDKAQETCTYKTEDCEPLCGTDTLTCSARIDQIGCY